MVKNTLLWRLASLLACSAAPLAAAQQGPAAGSREALWPAPTAEDWARPCRITWQRSYQDAVAISEESGKPILVCVNMDGEIASEHYAGIRYRQPEIARLYEPYVCVIASTYRHTPRDFDEEGRRIPCPRFGSVTCGEHISIEPGLFEKYFEGQRVAPRHIAVEVEKESAEMYDVYYALDTDSVFEAIRSGVEGREPPLPETRSDRPILERVASRHIVDREAVEAAYLAGSREERVALLRVAIASSEAAPVGLVRLAVHDLDPELARLGRRALGQTSSPSAVELIKETLRGPMDEADREALVDALERIGETSPKARTLAVAHRGLAGSESAIDAEVWIAALASVDWNAPERRASYEARLERTGGVVDDAGSRLAFAEACLEIALDANTDPRFAPLYLEDGQRAALDALELGASGWRVDAALAVAARERGEWREAYERAGAAVKTMPAGEAGALAKGCLLLFAQARQRQIVRAVRFRQDWPAAWIADVHAAYSVLARHPLGEDGEIAMHYDFLRWFGSPLAEDALDRGLDRFPASWILHDRLRGTLLKERGAEGLEAAYEERLQRHGPVANFQWYAGYTAVVTAEFLRRAGKNEEATRAYGRALEHYELALEENPASREASDHYIALVFAALARVRMEQGDLHAAVQAIEASFDRRTEAAASRDGLGLSPVATAQMLIARLEAAGELDAAAGLRARLEALGPELLRLPPNERGGTPSPDARRFGR